MEKLNPTSDSAETNTFSDAVKTPAVLPSAVNVIGISWEVPLTMVLIVISAAAFDESAPVSVILIYMFVVYRLNPYGVSIIGRIVVIDGILHSVRERHHGGTTGI